jgi:Flp pilus assembly CpaE family ATPase
MAESLADDADIAVLESEAARMGSVLAIIPAAPGSALSTVLGQRAWSVASDWYLGWPQG